MARFQPGQSGNPGGRPKGNYPERCRRWMESYGWGFLERVAQGHEEGCGDLRLRFEVIRLILSYGYGKPREAIDVNTQCFGPASLAEFLKQALDEPSPPPAIAYAPQEKTPPPQ